MIIGFAFAAGLGFGLVAGLCIALWFARLTYLDVREGRLVRNNAANF